MENDEFVFHNFLDQQTFTANPTALEILRRLHVWTDLEAIRGYFPGYSRESIDRSIDQLIELGALLTEESEAALLDDEYARTWAWGPLAAAYHFGTRDGAFISAEDGMDMLRQQAKFIPSPPLYQRNSNPATDIPLPLQQDYSEPFLTMAKRRTNRVMLEAPIALEHLADCFLFSMAITAFIEDPEIADLPLKMTPSGGGRNPYEAYVCVRNVAGLSPGTYHYSALERTLGVVGAAPPPPFPDMLAGQQWSSTAAAVIFLVANFERPMWKYQDPHGYRVVTMEAGHIAQNIMLVATRYGFVANPSGAFTRRLIEETLGVGGVTQSVVYALVLGVPAPEPDAPPSSPQLDP
ncbi:MAG TPA: SagB/ThcOx family dehydrogenase [Caulobacteraceae bacterium]|nr:SagB/ThcOx family dehydrogenase [Caulobacteraceae bacterium]